MTNAEKFKTAEERAKEFDKWCHTRGGCDVCILRDAGIELSTCVCSFYWLDLKAEEEKPLPCPFCRGETWVRDFVPANGRVYDIRCRGCEYRSQRFYIKEHAIAAHNRVARAVMESKNKDDK